MARSTAWITARRRRLGGLGLRPVLVFLCLAWGGLQPAYAMFCGSGIVSEGASKPEVVQKCGAPTFVDNRVEYTTVYVSPSLPPAPHPQHAGEDRRRTQRRGPPEPDAHPQHPRQPQRQAGRHPHPELPVVVYPPQPVVIAVTIDEWTYNFGPHNLMYQLRFENGVLRSLKTLQYGY